MIIIGKKDRSLAIEAIDLEEGTITFTKDMENAMKYNDHWKPEVELDMLRHNFNDIYGKELNDMTVVDFYPEDDYYQPREERYDGQPMEAPDVAPGPGITLDADFFDELLGDE